jgi:regulator of replication initiation timing
MSEVIHSFNTGMPRGYEKLDGIELVKQKDGEKYRGVLVLGDGEDTFERRVQIPDVLEMWGYDPEDREREAEWQAYQADPEKYELMSLMRGMKNQLSELNDKITGLQKHIGTLERENKSLRAEIERLRTEGVPATNNKTVSTESAAEVIVEDNPNVIDENRAETKGYKVIGFAKDATGKDQIAVKNESIGDKGSLVYPEFLRHDEVIQQTEAPAPAPNETVITDVPGETAEVVETQDTQPEVTTGFRNRWNRVTGSIGRYMLGRQAAIHNGVYTLTDREGRRQAFIEEVEEGGTVDGYAYYERRNGARVAAAAGIAAVGAVLIWEFLEHKVWGESHSRTIRESITQNTGGLGAHEAIDKARDEQNAAAIATLGRRVDQLGAANPTIPSVGGGNAAGLHREFFNGSNGNHAFGVYLPINTHLFRNADGRYNIVLPNHSVLVHNIEWDRQGNLASWVRNELIDKQNELAQKHNIHFINANGQRHTHYVTLVLGNKQ